MGDVGAVRGRSRSAVRSRHALPGELEAHVLDWPSACVRLVRVARANGDGEPTGGAAGGTLAAEAMGEALDVLCNGLCPVHNVACLGEHVYVFLRSAKGEVSASVPNLKLGTPQLLGAFVVDTAEQFEAASAPGACASALRDTRIGGEREVEAIVAKLASEPGRAHARRLMDDASTVY